MNNLSHLFQLAPDLDADTAAVIGHGNVALDVARILLTPISLLRVCLINNNPVGMTKWLACPPHAVGRGFTSWRGHTKDHHKNSTSCLLGMQLLG